MKTLVFIIAVIFCVTAQVSLLAQDYINDNNYLMKLSISGNKFHPRGYLMSTTDSTITISTRNSILPKDQRTFKVDDIKCITLKNQLHKKVGIVAGVCAGIAAALIIGHYTPVSKDGLGFSQEDNIIVSSIITIPSGAILGALIAGNKRPIFIKNKRKNYAEQRSVIEKYKYRVN